MAEINDFPLNMGFGRIKCKRQIWFETNCDGMCGMEALRRVNKMMRHWLKTKQRRRFLRRLTWTEGKYPGYSASQ